MATGTRLWDAFLATNARVLADPQLDCTLSGATLTVSILDDRTLTTAWVGDSRAVLVRRESHTIMGYDLTVDHKPGLPEELHRIVQAGGRVQSLVVRPASF